MPRLGDCGSVKNAVPLQHDSNSKCYGKDLCNVSELIKQLLVENPEMVSVQVNEEFAEREDWASIQLKEGDNVDFLYFMGGGAL